jgi:hypothetical protein
MKSIGTFILNILFFSRFKKELGKAAKAADEASPEFKAALLDFEFQVERLRDMQKRHKSLRRVAKGYTGRSPETIPPEPNPTTVDSKNSILDNLEVMKNDLGRMTWNEGIKTCNKLGNGWRLPTLNELREIRHNADNIGNFEERFYWSSSVQGGEYWAYCLHFKSGQETTYVTNRLNTNFVRAVRDLK